MCGVVGFWNREGEVANEVILEKMIDRIRYRGPDAKGIWTSGSVGLGHCRLSILDLSIRAHQPFVTADGKGVLSYNGEVYNFRELRANLESQGIQFRSTGDTEVVLYALHTWGPEKAIPLFNGMFAFAYFDLRTETLWLGRDRLGIKPLYVSCSNRKIIFASEIKSILVHPAVVSRPDMHILSSIVSAERLAGEWAPQEWTPFEGISALKPGTYCKVTQDSFKETVYFDLLRDIDIGRLISAMQESRENFQAQFANVFCESVKAHLVSDVSLAMMCSGGVDSSLMAAFIKDHKVDVLAYVADVKGAMPEGEKAKLVGRHLNVEVRQVDVDEGLCLRLWPQSIWHGDLPSYHPHDMPFLAVAQACARDGFKVVLTGEGSDELFGGYPWQAEIYRIWHRRRLQSLFIKNISPFRLIGRFIPNLLPLNFELLKQYPFSRISQLENTEKLTRYACALDGAQSMIRYDAIFQRLEAVKPIEERAFLARTFNDWYGYLQTLLHRNDRMGMAASIESRVPFLENGMIDLAMHLPASGKYHGGITKWVVKKTAEKRLPRSIVHAPKIGFAVAKEAWRAAIPLIQNGMVPNLFRWDKSSINNIMQRVVKEPYVLLSLAGVEIWARIFLRGQSPEDIGERLCYMGQIKKC